MDDSQPKRDTEPIELYDIRRKIDLIDKQLLDLIVSRCDLAVSTLDLKRRHGLLAADVRREGEVTEGLPCLPRSVALIRNSCMASSGA